MAHQGVQYGTGLKEGSLMLKTRIDGAELDLHILGPRWNQAQIHATEHRLAVIQVNDWN